MIYFPAVAPQTAVVIQHSISAASKLKDRTKDTVAVEEIVPMVGREEVNALQFEVTLAHGKNVLVARDEDEN